MLFSEIIFGPIKSRRLGNSLGVNLLPTNAKICTFNCIYCECGYNFNAPDMQIASRAEVSQALEEKLRSLKAENASLDNITFAGNGEPTMHKDFATIIDDTIALRNQYYPQAEISVLSNSTLLNNPKIVDALLKVDKNIMKFDAPTNDMMRMINQPAQPYFSVEWLTERLKNFNGKLIVQTMFLRGTHNGEIVDNTTPEQIDAWISAMKEIRPAQIMIYPIDRATPEKNLVKVPRAELEVICERAKAAGLLNIEAFG